VILSGGLKAENVAEAIAVARPYAVDTASGTESAPGRKDPERLRAFIDATAATGRAPGRRQPGGPSTTRTVASDRAISPVFPGPQA
jgi:phosphoribosylanthranilate isomerase